MLQLWRAPVGTALLNSDLKLSASFPSWTLWVRMLFLITVRLTVLPLV